MRPTDTAGVTGFGLHSLGGAYHVTAGRHLLDSGSVGR